MTLKPMRATRVGNKITNKLADYKIKSGIFFVAVEWIGLWKKYGDYFFFAIVKELLNGFTVDQFMLKILIAVGWTLKIETRLEIHKFVIELGVVDYIHR